MKGNHSQVSIRIKESIAISPVSKNDTVIPVNDFIIHGISPSNGCRRNLHINPTDTGGISRGIITMALRIPLPLNLLERNNANEKPTRKESVVEPKENIMVFHAACQNRSQFITYL